MKEKGFAATPAQYESRLKSWGVRKYNKKTEPRRAKIKAQRTRRHETAEPRQEAESGLQSIASSQNMQFPEEDNMDDPDFDAMELVNFNLEPPGPNNCFDSMDLAEFNLTPLGCNDLTPYMPPFTINDSILRQGSPFDFSKVFLFSNLDSLLRPFPALQLGGMIVRSVYDKLRTASTSNMLIRLHDSNFLYEFSNSAAAPIPHRFYSQGDLTGEDSSQLSNIPAATVNAARFDRRLIASIINGFEGLRNIPHDAVLKFLQRHYAIQEEVFECFDNQSSPVVKSFAENFFPTCVQFDKIEVVKFFINKKLVDANEAVCHLRGQKYTPLQYAAIYQSLSVVKHLVGLVDVNKSWSRARGSNAIDLLIKHMDHRRWHLDKNLQLVGAFLRRKATISVELARMVLVSFANERLGGRLLENMTGQTLQTLLSQKSLFRNVIKGGDSYLRQFHQQVDDAFGEAVHNGYHELIALMFPYTSFSHEAQQNANKAKNQVAIPLIEEDNPDPELAEGDSENSHTIISALKSKDQSLLRGLETRGVFDRLRGHQIGQVLTAALWAGNEEYATKILGLDPDFSFYGDSTDRLTRDGEFDISSAFKAALTRDFYDIAWKLLSVGLVVESRVHIHSLLSGAINAKKLDFVKAIIESRFNSPGLNHETWSIIKLAIELGQDSIVNDLWEDSHTAFRSTSGLLKLALVKGHKDLFFDIIKSSPVSHDFRKLGLQVAVQCEDESLFDELISLGVRADDDDILTEAIKEHPSMVKPLLDRYWKAYPQGRAGYGYGIIASALELHLTKDSWVSLDEMVTWNLLNPNHFLQTSDKEESLLVKAVATCDYAIVKKFITVGSEVNNITPVGYNLNNSRSMTRALLVAIATGIEQIVQLLLDHGANANEPAGFSIRRTPLQKAAEKNDTPIVNLLLSHGADVNAVPSTINGATALQFAAIHGNCDVASSLIMHGARPDIPPPRGIYGRWPLEGAAEHGRFDMIEFLWNAFGSLLKEQCQSAMLRAERNGHIGCKERIQELMAASNLSSLTALDS
ncbi:hypothetical protein F4825DRAFT_453908 [Nemania diffusa]|nr:hypothetical protein F4825DRAFT_453908 [Nemania diffusa]